MSERLKEIRENLIVKWPVKAVMILVVLGFSIGLVSESIEAALVAG